MNDEMEAQEPNKMVSQRDEHGRFLPGTIPNPNGRPRKELSLTSIAKRMLEAHPEMAEEITKKWLAQSQAGLTEARRDLQDRIEGKVPLPSVKIEGGGEPIVIRVVYEDKRG